MQHGYCYRVVRVVVPVGFAFGISLVGGRGGLSSAGGNGDETGGGDVGLDHGIGSNGLVLNGERCQRMEIEAAVKHTYAVIRTWCVLVTSC